MRKRSALVEAGLDGLLLPMEVYVLGVLKKEDAALLERVPPG